MNLFIVMAVVGTGTDTVKEDIRLIERIYEKYGDFMYTAALEVLGKKHDAEDAVNDALCRMIKYLPKLKGRSDEVICSMAAICIRSIVRNKAIDNYNRRKRISHHEVQPSYCDDCDVEGESSLEACFSDEADDTEEIIIRREECEAVRGAVEKLTPEMRDAVNLVYFCGLSCAEAGEYLGINTGAVRTRLYKARLRLKEILEKEYDIHGCRY